MSVDFFDLNTAPEQRDFDLIPADTICKVKMTLRKGGSGEGGMLKRSKSGDCEMLDCEFTVVDGPYAKRKFWESMIVNGVTEGHAKAAEISRGRLRAIVESARGIKRNDESEEARKARMVSLGDLAGMCFTAKVGIEKGAAKAGGDFWPDKNCLAAAITPDRKEWRVPEQPKSDAAEQPIKKPGWAS